MPYCALFLALLFSSITACGNWRAPDILLPPKDSCNIVDTMPPAFQVTATVQVVTQDSRETYMLALDTSEDSLQLVVLSGQGLPLYSVQAPEGNLRIRKLAGSSGRLTATAMISYLTMVYAEDAGLIDCAQSSQVRVEFSDGVRDFYRNGNQQRAARIRFQGKHPWFESARIEDIETGREVLFATLEVQRVSP